MKGVFKYAFILSLFAKANADCTAKTTKTDCCSDDTCGWTRSWNQQLSVLEDVCKPASDACADDGADFGQDDRCDCNPEYTFETDCLTKYPVGDENRKFCYCLQFWDGNCERNQGDCSAESWWADATTALGGSDLVNKCPPLVLLIVGGGKRIFVWKVVDLRVCGKKF